MSVRVRVSKSFKAGAKPLLKKYPSLASDLLRLEQELIQIPTSGTSLGQNVYKIRLKISSKGRGKSAGARVISLVEITSVEATDNADGDTIVNLIAIYDKIESASITDKELSQLIKAARAE